MTSNRWIILALLFFTRGVMGFQFQTVGSVAPILVEQLSLDYAAIGTLVGLYLLPGIFIALPGGALGERFGARWAVVAGLLLMAAGGALMMASSGFAGLALGRLVSGAGAVLMNVMLTTMVSNWFAGRDISTAMAILVTSFPVGIAIGLIGFVPLADAYGWPAVMAAGALSCVPCLIGVAAIYRDPAGKAKVTRITIKPTLTRPEWLRVSLAGVTWATYNVGYFVLVSFLPGHFVVHGYSLAQANAIVSWLGWALMATIPLGGVLADRFDRPLTVMGASFAVGAAASLLLAFNIMPIVSFAIVAIAVGHCAGPAVALPSLTVSAANRASGIAVYFTWYYVLISTFPALAGLGRDITGSTATPVLFAAAMLAIALAGVVALHFAIHTPAQKHFPAG